MVRLQTIEVSESDFMKVMEKRVRKEVRQGRLIVKDDRILIVDDGSAEFNVTEYLLKRIIKQLPVKINVKKLSYNLGDDIKGSFNKILIPWNVDMEDEYFLGCVFENKKMPYLGHFEKDKKMYIKLLLPMLASEVEDFAKIRKFKFKKRQKKTHVAEMIDQLESEYPEVKFSLLKSSRKIKKDI